MDLEDAVRALWKEGIYAESGMGCTGPIVLVSEAKIGNATDALVKAGFVAKESNDC
jgi:glycine reductase